MEEIDGRKGLVRRSCRGALAALVVLAAALAAGCPHSPSNGDGGPDGGEPDASDGDADADVDCEGRPTGLRAAAVTHAGCAWLDDGLLGELTIDRWCTLDTERECRLTCDPADEPPGVSTCLVEADEVEHLEEGQLCVLTVAALTITADGWLDLVGPHPVAILSAGPMRVDGMVAADAHGELPGPGGYPGGGYRSGGHGPGSGAAGGSNDGGGGAGHAGEGGDGTDDEGEAGQGGPAYGSCDAVALEGGSGGGGAYEESAHGGGGGGAVHLFSARRLTIGRLGAVSARGGAGGPGYPTSSSGCGGGGGGSGGTILLEAPVVVVDGVARADGGHGGEDHEGRNGGAGGAGEEVDGEDGTVVPDAYGGGGGGGAAGRVFVLTFEGETSSGSGTLSPVLPDCETGEIVCE